MAHLKEEVDVAAIQTGANPKPMIITNSSHGCEVNGVTLSKALKQEAKISSPSFRCKVDFNPSSKITIKTSGVTLPAWVGNGDTLLITLSALANKGDVIDVILTEGPCGSCEESAHVQQASVRMMSSNPPAPQTSPNQIVVD